MNKQFLKFTMIKLAVSVSFAMLFIYVLIIVLKTQYSRLELLGEIDVTRLSDFMNNQELGGRYMIIANERAREIEVINKLLEKKNIKDQDILLVFYGKFDNGNSLVYAKEESSLRAKFFNSSGVSVYSVSWKRIKMPPGISVK